MRNWLKELERYREQLVHEHDCQIAALGIAIATIRGQKLPSKPLDVLYRKYMRGWHQHIWNKDFDTLHLNEPASTTAENTPKKDSEKV